MHASRMSPWHLRQFHRRASHRHLGDESSKGNNTQSADSIFGKAPSSYFGTKHESSTFQDQKTVTGIVDGEEVVFELRENITQRPTVDRATRFEERDIKALNNVRSKWDVRFRLWLMHFSFPQIKLAFVAAYMALGFVFAGLWFIENDKCCDDPDMSFVETFDFAFQTISTIGYGGYVPIGIFSNFLVVMISVLGIMLTSIYSGLLYFKFSNPLAKIQFSEIMTLSNVNGIPCIELRVGNCDGNRNVLIDVSASMAYQYNIKYTDEKGEERRFGQTEHVKLLSDKLHALKEVVWTLRHVIDEDSPLFGLNLLEPPGNSIFQFNVCLNATQRVTGAPVFADIEYEVQDLMIGHRFVDQIEVDSAGKKAVCDFAKFDDTVPHPVWYPTARRQVD